jgi:hypothetical protein
MYQNKILQEMKTIMKNLRVNICQNKILPKKKKENCNE